MARYHVRCKRCSLNKKTNDMDDANAIRIHHAYLYGEKHEVVIKDMGPPSAFAKSFRKITEFFS